MLPQAGCFRRPSVLHWRPPFVSIPSLLPPAAVALPSYFETRALSTGLSSLSLWLNGPGRRLLSYIRDGRNADGGNSSMHSWAVTRLLLEAVPLVYVSAALAALSFPVFAAAAALRRLPGCARAAGAVAAIPGLLAAVAAGALFRISPSRRVVVARSSAVVCCVNACRHHWLSLFASSS